MKLDRACLLAVFVVAMTGCGARAATAPARSAQAPTVSSTLLMAAELRDTDDAPKVGKSQRSDSSAIDDEEGKREESSHGGLDRKHGGFSGYK